MAGWKNWKWGKTRNTPKTRRLNKININQLESPSVSQHGHLICTTTILMHWHCHNYMASGREMPNMAWHGERSDMMTKTHTQFNWHKSKFDKKIGKENTILRAAYNNTNGNSERMIFKIHPKKPLISSIHAIYIRIKRNLTTKNNERKTPSNSINDHNVAVGRRLPLQSIKCSLIDGGYLVIKCDTMMKISMQRKN